MTKIDWILLLVCIRLAIDFISIGWFQGRRLYYIIKKSRMVDLEAEVAGHCLEKQIAEATGPCQICLKRTASHCLRCRQNVCGQACFTGHIKISKDCAPPEHPVA